MGSERGDMAGAARREVEDARVRLSEAAGRVKHEAMSAGSTISALVFDELDRRGGDLSDGLQHIAEKMRSMADTDDGGGERPRMVQQAVDVIDDLAQRLRAQSSRDLSDKVARFGRENPMTFMTACLVSGVLAGRFLIAQSDGDDGPGRRHKAGGFGAGAGDTYGRQDWQGPAERQEGAFAGRDASDPQSAGRRDTSEFAARFRTGSPDEDAPSDLDLGPDDSAGSGMDHSTGPDADNAGGPGRGGSHG